MKLFTDEDYWKLASLFSGPYAGYRPEVQEAPNGDGKVDTQKRSLHVALKYQPPAWAQAYLARAHFEACRIAEVLCVPDEFYPRVQDGTLRVLDYPAGAGSAEHTDFDLFTVHCYRSHPEDFVRTYTDYRSEIAEAIDPDLHLGELAELVRVGNATPHYVPARPYSQRAIVYFAMPSMDACLPDGRTVREWLAERYARSRVYK